ncbi:hypothetical protein pdam_00021082 [Pocillopora damicornis]|uniref:Ig-like domain-containing protein n=1 Tax=Pocillopora damicornis TaxID=46731 RepID=A0A3M6TVA2_POCDA|nr:hypothetical protein pdam_00021082 [Pocillopora damicornis]
MQKGTSARNLVKRSAEFLVTLLFMRIEFVDNNSKALETRLEYRIQRIDDDLKTNIERIVKKRLQIYETASTTRRKERRDIIFNKSLLIRTSVLLAFFNNQHHSFESKIGSVSSIIRDYQRERRNVAAGTITLQQVRQEINNKFNKSCSVNNKICQTGPPGPPSAHGYPGYKREKRATGKTGTRGPSGPIGAPGVSGKRGPEGPQGVKGDKGDKGSVGAREIRGETGTKGRKGQKVSIGLKGSKGSRGLVGIQGPKGECVVPLKISAYPVSQEVFVDEPVIFYCWVQGHLSSKITLRKLAGTLSDATTEDGALRISSVQRSHAGLYMCTAHTGLGMFRIISRLHVKEPPKFTNRPPTVVNTLRGTNVTLCCEASGSPRPNVEWFQVKKSSVLYPVLQEDGCLLIEMGEENVDFICRAKNSFGLVETKTTAIAKIFRGNFGDLLLLQSFRNM